MNETGFEDFKCNVESSMPLSTQLANEIRTRIEAGRLQPHQQMPAIRVLAGQLKVNPATVDRAYKKLKDEGLVISRQGGGTRVVGDPHPSVPKRPAAAAGVLLELRVNVFGPPPQLTQSMIKTQRAPFVPPVGTDLFLGTTTDSAYVRRLYWDVGTDYVVVQAECRVQDIDRAVRILGTCGWTNEFP